MVGDATDRKRWEDYARLLNGAARLEDRARNRRTEKGEALRLLDEARRLRSYAHSLTV